MGRGKESGSDAGSGYGLEDEPLAKRLVNTRNLRALLSNYQAANKPERSAVIAKRAGLKTSDVEDVLQGKNVYFDVADKILCAIEMPEEWYLSMSAEYYGPDEERPEEVAKAAAFWEAIR